ncbi:hypothetical protein [uncultured Algibacter sp.]|uniref:hypothetical protein n=1 Tax=uncultured Algibacter sp. TaxID=298659 RepID=UPI003216C8DA
MKRTTFKITFENGETRSATLKPKFPAKYIATVSPKDAQDPTKFKGDYGIDWCDMDTSFSKIEKFQNTKATDISHELVEATSQFKSGGTHAEKQALLKKMYEIDKYQGKDYPLTWINLPQGKTVTLNIKTHIISGDDEDTDFLTIVKNANFEIAYDKKTDKGTNPAIKLDKIKKRKKKGTDIEITALNTFAQTEYIIIQDYKGDDVGKIEMAPNNLETLDIKIIPVVFKSTPVTEKTEAQTLYASAINGGKLIDTLNNKALSQIGITCSIAQIKPVPECVVIDLSINNWNQFYKKGIFKDWEYQNTTAKPSISIDEDGEKSYHSSDLSPRFLLDKLEDTYFAKYGNAYKGAIVFVTDKDFNLPNMQGYSQTDPIRSQGTVIFNSGLNDVSVFAHEISHMLGLEHTFFKDATETTNTNDKLGDLPKGKGVKSIVDRKKEIEGLIKHSQNYIKKEQEVIKKIKADNKVLSQRNLNDIKASEESIKDSKKSIDRYKDGLRKIDIARVCNFKVTKTKTKNYMDYINDRTYFAKHQAELARKECKDFYK